MPLHQLSKLLQGAMLRSDSQNAFTYGGAKTFYGLGMIIDDHIKYFAPEAIYTIAVVPSINATVNSITVE